MRYLLYLIIIYLVTIHIIYINTFQIVYFKLDYSNTDHNYFYYFIENGSIFYLIVPLNKNDVCGITDIFCRRVCKPIFNALYLLPIIYYEPYYGSHIRNIACINDDFPAPVRPIIPIFYLFYILKFIFLRTIGNYLRYLIE